MLPVRRGEAGGREGRRAVRVVDVGSDGGSEGWVVRCAGADAVLSAVRPVEVFRRGGGGDRAAVVRARQGRPPSEGRPRQVAGRRVRHVLQRASGDAHVDGGRRVSDDRRFAAGDTRLRETQRRPQPRHGGQPRALATTTTQGLFLARRGRRGRASSSSSSNKAARVAAALRRGRRRLHLRRGVLVLLRAHVWLLLRPQSETVLQRPLPRVLPPLCSGGLPQSPPRRRTTIGRWWGRQKSPRPRGAADGSGGFK
mmetsp:Transcript_17676/g.53916  ORF Transcript_17676/g.53916 Transcript_17676/m.53916 type:complete len:254 (+) Transcript_17676:564-1325(+)